MWSKILGRIWTFNHPGLHGQMNFSGSKMVKVIIIMNGKCRNMTRKTEKILVGADSIQSDPPRRTRFCGPFVCVKTNE